MATFSTFSFPYSPAGQHTIQVAHFSFKYAIDQPVKTYSGEAGLLAGSQLWSAFSLQQPLIGVGILWKYGYYEQERKADQTMKGSFQEKIYEFLVDTQLRFTRLINA